MPKGVLWRHEDIFFAAMGGGDPLSLGNVISTPEELAERVLRPGIMALAIPPFMHAGCALAGVLHLVRRRQGGDAARRAVRSRRGVAIGGEPRG